MYEQQYEQLVFAICSLYSILVITGEYAEQNTTTKIFGDDDDSEKNAGTRTGTSEDDSMSPLTTIKIFIREKNAKRSKRTLYAFRCLLINARKRSTGPPKYNCSFLVVVFS